MCHPVRMLLMLFMLSLLIVMAGIARADARFTINEIRVQGNTRIQLDTILDYLPVHLGQQLSQEQFAEVIRALYQTGFFTDVALQRDGDTLVVSVHERPTINSIDFTGNRVINKDKVNEVLKEVGLVRGNTFDQAVLERVEKSLRSVYIEQGRYNAMINAAIKPLPRNRVDLKITIFEGDKVKIREIDVLGNHAFTRRALVKKMDLTTPRPWSFLTDSDKYSKDKFSQDMEKVTDFYKNKGYLRAQIAAGQALLSPDRAWAHLVLKVKEGKVYRLRGYRFVGELLTTKEQLAPFVALSSGSVYSEAAVDDATRQLTSYYTDKGYAFATIQVVPDIDDEKQQVFLNYYIEPGKLVMVRRIDFSGNVKTSQEVLRREMRQFEGGLYNQSSIDESLRRLRNLGYLEDVNVELRPVAGSDDQVDLAISVKEKSAAQAAVTAGYGTGGILFGASLSHENFLGTGKAVGVNFDRDSYRQIYKFNYVNPYYTDNGVSRGVEFYSSKTTPGRLNIAHYTYDSLGGSINYRIPLSNFSGVSAGVGLENVELRLGDKPSTELTTFTRDYGTSFDHALLNVGWDYSNYDKKPFATRGIGHEATLSVSAPVNEKPLNYYKADYSLHWYQPLNKQLTLFLGGSAGYGRGYGEKGDSLPLLQNYYAGGIGYGAGTVNGYNINALGPKDSNGFPIGGDTLLTGTVHVIFPNPISEDMRTSLFIDGGNVFDARSHRSYEQIKLSNLRYASGLSIEWRLAMLGMLQLTFAKPLNAKPGDETRFFQFSFGTGF